ncbi:hypothetical protein QQF73_09970 [Marinobacter sp. M216]|uniref:Sulfur reduction protein DsrE n=1 Tax=Marinobacter albus TaxID=3030833 RepID=A0ABT7HC71_9GAMM|nr:MULTISPECIES: hypothetical protein [unclassified Marinobacter]MBW7469792.1 hypothetical protein [Marinobacter sp. F4218]MDK9557949.1 hypothetical protein [Marinobacter sp. M216]
MALMLSATVLRAEMPVNPGKPFAETFLLLQLSDGDPEKQDMVLSVAGNLLEHYQPDLVDIEITTFGPGVRLLYADNDRRELIKSLMAQGVRFSVCMNTIDTIERGTGNRPELIPDILRVPVGVAHILERIDQGYVLVRP